MKTPERQLAEQFIEKLRSLTTLDDLSAAHRRKLAALQVHKKGMM